MLSLDSSVLRCRRDWLKSFGAGLGTLALAELINPREAHALPAAGTLHHLPRAKRIIWLFQSGGPSQLDLFDHKPLLNERHGTQLPAEVRMGKGKGAPEQWVAVVKPGRIMYEMTGVGEDVAREALRRAANKLPIRTRVVMRGLHS